MEREVGAAMEGILPSVDLKRGIWAHLKVLP